MSTFVSLDCSLPSGPLSKAMQRTLINVALPGIFTALALPVWLLLWLCHRRSARRVDASPPPEHEDDDDKDGDDEGGSSSDESDTEAEHRDGGRAAGKGRPGAAPRTAGACTPGPAAVAEGVEDSAKALSLSEEPIGPSKAGKGAETQQLTASHAGGAAGGSQGEPYGLRAYLAVRMTVTLLGVLFFFYPSVTDELLSILQCQKVGWMRALWFTARH